MSWAKIFQSLPVAVASALLLSSCAAPSTFVGQQQAAGPAAAADGISVRSPLTGTMGDGDDLEQVVLDAIAAARRSISLAVQELILPRIAQALVERHRAGVNVRVVLENSYSTPWSRQHPSDRMAPSPRLSDQRGMQWLCCWRTVCLYWMTRRMGVPAAD